MTFYFIAHVLLGIIPAAASLLVMRGRGSVASVPFWVHSFAPMFFIGGLLACFGATITTFVNFGLMWTLATLAEIALGAIIAAMLPMGLQAFLVMTSPITILAILGDLWKFWHLG